MKAKKHPIVSFIMSYGWVMVFMTVVSVVYIKASTKRAKTYAFFSERLETLQKKHEEVLSTHHILSRKVQSQSDPEWVELTLKKVLGLVPEGQSKIHFKTNP